MILIPFEIASAPDPFYFESNQAYIMKSGTVTYSPAFYIERKKHILISVFQQILLSHDHLIDAFHVQRHILDILTPLDCATRTDLLG